MQEHLCASQEAMLNKLAKRYAASIMFCVSDKTDLAEVYDLVMEHDGDISDFENIVIWRPFSENELDDIQNELCSYYDFVLTILQDGMYSVNLLMPSEIEQGIDEGWRLELNSDNDLTLVVCDDVTAMSQGKVGIDAVFDYIATQALAGSETHIKLLHLIRNTNAEQHAQYIHDVKIIEVVSNVPAVIASGLGHVFKVERSNGQVAVFLDMLSAVNYQKLYRHTVGLPVPVNG